MTVRKDRPDRNLKNVSESNPLSLKHVNNIQGIWSFPCLIPLLYINVQFINTSIL